MKKIILVLVAVSILIAGCNFFPEPEEDLTGFKDCKQSQECIMNSVKNCEKAFASSKDTFMGDAKAELKVIVYGMQEGNCKIKYKTGNLEGDAGLMSQAVFSLIANKEMVCLVPKEKINLATKGMTEELMKNYCSGSLIDAINSIEETMKDMQ